MLGGRCTFFRQLPRLQSIRVAFSRAPMATVLRDESKEARKVDSWTMVYL